MISRPGFLSGLAATLAAPAIIRTPGLLMPIRALITDGVSLTSLEHQVNDLLNESMDLNETSLERMIIEINRVRSGRHLVYAGGGLRMLYLDEMRA